MSDELDYAKVFLYFVSRRLDSRDPNFRTLFIQYGQQDEQYSFGAAEKVHRGQLGRVLKGYISSNSPYCYKCLDIVDGQGDLAGMSVETPNNPRLDYGPGGFGCRDIEN